MSTHISRRNLLTGALGGLLLAPSAVRGAVTNADALLSNARGGYLYLPPPLIKFRSLGVLAAPGFEIVRATFRRASPFPDGLAEVERHVRSADRSMEALCGLEMRSGKQATLDEFIAFNGVYLERLRKAGALIDGQVPLAVTNVALPVQRLHTEFTRSRTPCQRLLRPSGDRRSSSPAYRTCGTRGRRRRLWPTATCRRPGLPRKSRSSSRRLKVCSRRWERDGVMRPESSFTPCKISNEYSRASWRRKSAMPRGEAYCAIAHCCLSRVVTSKSTRARHAWKSPSTTRPTISAFAVRLSDGIFRTHEERAAAPGLPRDADRSLVPRARRVFRG